MKEMFGEHGIPAVVKSDNGPQYSGQLFTEFAESYGFQHITSSPHHPQSNGFIEAQVKVVKRTLKKAIDSGKDPQMALLSLRATPLDQSLPSPGELLLGRPIQDNLPRNIPRSQLDDAVRNQLEKRQQQQKAYFDQQTRPLRPLINGQHVNVQHPSTGRWEPATVLQQAAEPRSYVVQTDQGSELRRNRIHIRDKPQDATATSGNVPTASQATAGRAMCGPQATEASPHPADGPALATRTRAGLTVKPRVRLDL